MINVLIYIESRFPTQRKKLRQKVISYLRTKLSGDVEVSIRIVGDRKMKMLNHKYRQKDVTTDVLSFPINDPSTSSKKDIEMGFTPEKSSPDDVLRLGDVILSYPQAVMAAAKDNVMVDIKIEALLHHGLDHLMGKHHS